MQYVELHARSAFSFLTGASLPEALAYACMEHDLRAMALLDRNGVYGSARFHLTAKANNIRAHVGSEVSVAASGSAPASYYPLLVRNRTGYQNLCRLITKTKLRAPKNTPTAAKLLELEEHASGLVCLTGDEDGPLAQALHEGGKREARRTLEGLVSIFGPANVYVELQRHFRPEQECRNHAAIELARELKLPLLATNGVLYAKPSDREVLDALICIKNRCTLDEAGRRLQVNSKRHVHSGKEMEQLFADIPEPISQTAELSSRLEFTLENRDIDSPNIRYPAEEPKLSFCVHRSSTEHASDFGRSPKRFSAKSNAN
jgi:error-prone DNA polymerase